MISDTLIVVRRYRALLSDEQLEKFETAQIAQDELFNFALKYLYRVYGVKTKRRFPKGSNKRGEIRIAIKNRYLEYLDLPESKKTGKRRWMASEIGLSSQQADTMLTKLLTNFGLYWSRMDRMRRTMTTEEKESFAKIRGRAYYSVGRIARRDCSSQPMTVVTPSNGGHAYVTSAHHIKVPHFGTVRVHQWINNHKNDRIQQVGLKLVRPAKGKKPVIVEIQLVIQINTPQKKEVVSEVGLDWGMKDNSVYTSSDGDVHTIPGDLIKRMHDLEAKARSLQSLADKSSPSRRKGLLERRRYLLAKRSHIMDEYYIKLAHSLCEKYDLIAIERLDPLSMRRPGRKRRRSGKTSASRGINRKLALTKPGRLCEIMTWVAQKTGTTLLKVDPYKTSQVEFGQSPATAIKHDLSVRQWKSKLSGRVILRDKNAAQNILYWAKHPWRHAKHILKGVQIELLVEAF